MPAASPKTADVLRFNCPHCRRTNRVPVAYAGRKGRCPGCKQEVYVPGSGVRVGATDSHLAAVRSSGSGSRRIARPAGETGSGLFRDRQALAEHLEQELRKGKKRHHVREELIARGVRSDVLDPLLREVSRRCNRLAGQAKVFFGVALLAIGVWLLGDDYALYQSGEGFPLRQAVDDLSVFTAGALAVVVGGLQALTGLKSDYHPFS